VSRALRWIAAAALCAGGARAPAQVPTPPQTSIWLADSLRWGGIVMPPAAGDCPAAPAGPHRLPPRPQGNWLGLVFADGRQSCWDSLNAAGGVLYWPLERAAYALNARVVWDPELMRGELVFADTVQCAFIVGAEFLHCGPLAMQMRAPVLYLGNRVLLPVDCLSLMTREILADRFRFSENPPLLLQRPASGPLATMTSEQVGNRSYFAWKLPDSRDVSFTTDGFGTITLDVPGVRLDPAHPPQPEPRAGGCLWAVRPSSAGVAYVLRVDPGIRAWRIQAREQGGEVRLALSANASDRDREGYRPWDPPHARERGKDSGPVVLVLPDPQEGDLAEAPGDVKSLLREVADQVRARLADGEIDVVIMETAGRSNWQRGIGARVPSVCICLLPDLAGRTLPPGLRLVTAEPLPGERPAFPLDELPAPLAAPAKGTGGADGPVLRRWEAVATAHAGGTHRLAWLMQLYLETEFPSGPFTRGHWPGALLDGIDAPAVALYFGEVGSWAGDEPQGASSDSVYLPPPLSERMATAIAGAVLMFLMGDQSG
jgi:hypothetical protein